MGYPESKFISSGEDALENVTAGTLTANKAVIVDENGQINTLDIIALEVNGVAITAGGADINKTSSLHIPTQATPVNAVAATGTLTISGVVIDGQTVTIGDDVYEFCADAAQTITGDNIAVDIEAVSTKSQGTLTIDTQPTAGNTMTIGTKVYTFVPVGTANADGEVSVGADLATAKTAIVAAINGTDSVNTAHTQVTAAVFAVNNCVLTALIGGVAGDLIATTETFTAGSNIFDAVTLGTTTPGVDCVQADAVTALALAITTSDTQGVSGVDGVGDTVVLTADTKGIAGNSIATTETMANSAFAQVTLTGGVNGTVGTVVGQIVHYDSTYLYYLNAANTISDNNWRRITKGSAY